MRNASSLALLWMLSCAAPPGALPVPGYQVASSEHLEGPFTNRLVTATSPYLLLHAHDPVDWRPWGPEALAEAARRDAPIFLSVGYTACHWCHVMQRESFSDPVVAARLNAWFVPVKVDREERPDVDGLYMEAVQLFTGQGGWPASLWLTPDGRPLYAGTYFPPEARFGRPAFGEVLDEVHRRWTEDREGAEAVASEVTAGVRRRAVIPAADGFPADAPSRGVVDLDETWDAVHAGWGKQKFPLAPNLEFLLAHGVAHGDAHALSRVRAALDAMDRGGLHDHLGGGFHRYTVDPAWAVPHFEKMTYDNGQLLRLYAEASVALEEPRYAALARDTATWLLSEMRAPDGTFYSSIGATDPVGEGVFYTWTPAEIREVLGADADAFLAAYGVTDAGNSEGGRTVLARAPEAEASSLGEARGRLYAARAVRPAPPTDTKRVVAYNALAIAGLARAGRLLDEPEWVRAAAAAASQVLDARDGDGALPRTLDPGSPRGIVDDYAFLVEALLDLYEADPEPRWLREAGALFAVLVDRFGDPEEGGFWETDRVAEPLLARRKDFTDGSVPSGASRAVVAAWRLRSYGAPGADAVVLERALAAAGRLLEHAPGAVPTLLVVVDGLSRASLQAVVTTAPGARERSLPFVEAFDARYRPFAVLAVTDPEAEEALGGFAALQGKAAGAAPVLGYVCLDGVCKQPTTDADVFRRSLDSRKAVEGGGTGALP